LLGNDEEEGIDNFVVSRRKLEDINPLNEEEKALHAKNEQLR